MSLLMIEVEKELADVEDRAKRCLAGAEHGALLDDYFTEDSILRLCRALQMSTNALETLENCLPAAASKWSSFSRETSELVLKALRGEK